MCCPFLLVLRNWMFLNWRIILQITAKVFFVFPLFVFNQGTHPLAFSLSPSGIKSIFKQITVWFHDCGLDVHTWKFCVHAAVNKSAMFDSGFSRFAAGYLHGCLCFHDDVWVDKFCAADEGLLHVQISCWFGSTSEFWYSFCCCLSFPRFFFK